MDGLEHGVAVTDIGRAGGAHTTLNLGGLVGDDVAVQVGQYEHLELAAASLVDQVGGHNVDVPVLGGDAGILGGHLVADAGEVAVGLLHNVGLGDDGHVVLAVVLGVLKGGAGDAAGAGVGGHLKVHSQLVGYLHTAATQDVLALAVLTVEHPVDAQFGHAGGAHVGVQVQFAAHSHVGGLQIAAVGGGGGALQDDVALLQRGESIVGDGLAHLFTALDGETVDLAELHAAAGHVVGQQEAQHVLTGVGDDGTDAVTAADADGDVGQVGEIFSGLARLHPVLTSQLLGNQRAELLHRIINVFLHSLILLALWYTPAGRRLSE